MRVCVGCHAYFKSLQVAGLSCADEYCLHVALYVTGEDEQVKAAHTFLQRTLYRINRLVLFW